MTPQEIANRLLLPWDETDAYDARRTIAKALTDAVAAERRRCYAIAFNTPATSKEAIRVKASIADAIACGEFEEGL